MFVSSRHDGSIYKISSYGEKSTYAKGMGVATGIAFDHEDNLYVGDRTGTIFKIDRKREIFVFATIEPSVSAYHLAFDDEQNLYVTGPTTSSCDHVYKITSDGNVSTYFSGLEGHRGAFDAEGCLYVRLRWQDVEELFASLVTELQGWLWQAITWWFGLWLPPRFVSCQHQLGLQAQLRSSRQTASLSHERRNHSDRIGVADA
jgi:hypothetical protein